jgi:hypothetical protein
MSRAARPVAAEVDPLAASVAVRSERGPDPVLEAGPEYECERYEGS